MRHKCGMIQIYTGDGKGKTTAAIGLAIRAKGNDLKVCWISFHKDIENFYSEFKILKKIGIDVFAYAKYCPFLNPFKSEDVLTKNARNDCLKAVKFIKEEIYNRDYDVLILDEILISLREGYLNISEIFDLINSKPNAVELVLTGRCNDKELKELIKSADYVSKIEKIKHPYDKGIERRKGIEY